MTIKTPSAPLNHVGINEKAAKMARGGHPWVFSGAILELDENLSAGDIVDVVDEGKEFVGTGFYDGDKSLPLRVLCKEDLEEFRNTGLKRRLTEAFEIRQPFFSRKATTAFRLIHGENDHLPGLVVDKYAGVYVVKLYSAGWRFFLDEIVGSLTELPECESVILRHGSSKAMEILRDSELPNGMVLYGKKVDEPVVFKENGHLIEADLLKGQKTGFFLDQRDNRKRVEKLAIEKDVLNLFSFNGGFSLYAARGGALSVTDVDASQTALDQANRNFELNAHIKKMQGCEHHTICGDAFGVMEKMVDEGRTFGMVIVDPPSFAQKKTDVSPALKAYAKLMRFACRLLIPDGILVMASCSSRVKSKKFIELLRETAKKNNFDFRPFLQTGHPADHPIGFRDGEYLKCVFAKISKSNDEKR